MNQLTFDAIGTRWVIDFYEEISDGKFAEFQEKISKRIDVFDKAYSRFRSDSLVTHMSQLSGTYTLPDDAEKMLTLYKNLYDLTAGLVTPLIGQMLVDAGYDASYSLLQKRKLSAPPKWEDTISYSPITSPTSLTMLQSALLDFGAAGKGYLIDLVAEVIETAGITQYCIDAGGDIKHRNSKAPLKVGLEDPENFEQVIGVAHIQNTSLCASAGSRRMWAEFHHIIDPVTLKSPRDIIATWVIADTTLLADAIATCLFFVSPELLKATYNFDSVVLSHDRSVQVSNTSIYEIYR